MMIALYVCSVSCSTFLLVQHPKRAHRFVSSSFCQYFVCVFFNIIFNGSFYVHILFGVLLESQLLKWFSFKKYYKFYLCPRIFYLKTPKECHRFYRCGVKIAFIRCFANDRQKAKQTSNFVNFVINAIFKIRSSTRRIGVSTSRAYRLTSLKVVLNLYDTIVIKRNEGEQIFRCVKYYALCNA